MQVFQATECDIDTRPFSALSALPDNAVRWTGGFWAEKIDVVRYNTLDGMLEAIQDPKNAAYFGNFSAVARGEDTFFGRDWSDGDCYKVIEALALMYSITGDPGTDERMDRMIAEVAAAQAPDGYICTQVQLTRRKRWADPIVHELYNFGHLFTAAVAHKRLTGKHELLDVAVKAADYIYGTFIGRDPALAPFCFNPSQIMGLVDLYRETGDRRYLEIAGVFVDNRGSLPSRTVDDFVDGRSAQTKSYLDQTQDRVPLRQETEAVGHAVTAPYLYAGAADVFMETGEQALLDAVTRIWEDSTFKKMYVTGAIGSLHKGSSERSNPEYEKIWESYGRPFQLPNDSAYNETCANIANAMWSWRMLLISGDARYADVMETVIYNAGLSSMSLSGTHFFYTNPLRFNGERHNLLRNDSPTRWKRWTCYCCPPSIARTVAGMHRWAYCLSDDALWINLYGDNEVSVRTATSERLKLKQASNYPWQGDITITVEQAPASEYTINLRIPGWAEGATINVNGTPAQADIAPGRYAALSRVWKAGDTLKLRLPVEPRIVVGHPMVEEIRNQAAVMAGPVVYCLESRDLPEGVAMDEVRLRADGALDASSSAEGLDGLPVIRTSGSRIRADWPDNTLYRSAKAAAPETVAVQLIPYFAWNNRGATEMSVWLPLSGPVA